MLISFEIHSSGAQKKTTPFICAVASDEAIFCRLIPKRPIYTLLKWNFKIYAQKRKRTNVRVSLFLPLKYSGCGKNWTYILNERLTRSDAVLRENSRDFLTRLPDHLVGRLQTQTNPMSDGR